MKKIEFYKFKSKIHELCQDQGVKTLKLFGSTLHNTSNESSDVDLIVEFKDDVGLFTLIKLKQQLKDLIHNEVDLTTPSSISPYFKDTVLSEAEIIYDN